jgi:hypothetical protein
MFIAGFPCSLEIMAFLQKADRPANANRKQFIMNQKKRRMVVPVELPFYGHDIADSGQQPEHRALIRHSRPPALF